MLWKRTYELQNLGKWWKRTNVSWRNWRACTVGLIPSSPSIHQSPISVSDFSEIEIKTFPLKGFSFGESAWRNTSGFNNSTLDAFILTVNISLPCSVLLELWRRPLCTCFLFRKLFLLTRSVLKALSLCCSSPLLLNGLRGTMTLAVTWYFPEKVKSRMITGHGNLKMRYLDTRRTKCSFWYQKWWSCFWSLVLNFPAFWKIVMEGPPDTPYEKGVFELFCQFGCDYPVKPPLVRFVTPVSCQTYDLCPNRGRCSVWTWQTPNRNLRLNILQLQDYRVFLLFRSQKLIRMNRIHSFIH